MFNRLGKAQTNRGVLAIVAATALALTGCGGPADQSEVIDVVAAVYPYAYVAREILGSHGQVTDLSANAGDAHDVELSPKQVAALKDADLVVHQTGFQAAIDETIEKNKPKRVVDVTTLVDFIEFDDHSDHGHEAGHDHEKHEHGKDGHSHAGKDPHIWLDIEQLRKVGVEVNQQLDELYPAYKADFDANAKALDEKLAKLDADMTNGLKSCEIDHVIVNHGAFGYLGYRYGFHQVGISGLEPDVEPSPAQIERTSQAAKQYGVNTIFYETGVSDRVAKSIAKDLGLKARVLDPLEALSSKAKDANYETIMRQNLKELREANQCH